jgi:hypothetical protein
LSFLCKILFTLSFGEPSRAKEKDILGLRRNSLTRRPLNFFYPSPKEEGWWVDEVLLKG